MKQKQGDCNRFFYGKKNQIDAHVKSGFDNEIFVR